MKKIAGTRPTKLPSPKKVDPSKILTQAKKLSTGQGLQAFKKMYGNDRGAFLHKQASPANKVNTIGKPCR